MKTIHVKNLEKFHPSYKDRTLIWCKTYFSMINSDPDFEMLDEIDKWRFICFIMLELQLQKPLPLDPKYLSRKGFDLKKRPIDVTLRMLHTLIDVHTDPLRKCDVDKSRVEKKREEEKREENGRFAPPTLSEVNDYANLEGYNVDCHKFWNHYESNGWMVGKNKMKSWKAAIAKWHEGPRKKKKDEGWSKEKQEQWNNNLLAGTFE